MVPIPIIFLRLLCVYLDIGHDLNLSQIKVNDTGKLKKKVRKVFFLFCIRIPNPKGGSVVLRTGGRDWVRRAPV